MTPQQIAGLPLVAMLLSGCASNFSGKPELQSAATRPTSLPDEPAPSRLQLEAALDTLFTGSSSFYSFCEASPAERQCVNPDDGLSGVGLGGLFLPLVFEVNSLEIAKAQRDGEAWRLASEFTASVNTVPPICSATDGLATIRGEGTVSIDFEAFYCNWLVIGNVVTKIDLFLDSIDPKGDSFSGAYAVQFNGTGNVFGTGYFIGRRKVQQPG